MSAREGPNLRQHQPSRGRRHSPKAELVQQHLAALAAHGTTRYVERESIPTHVIIAKTRGIPHETMICYLATWNTSEVSESHNRDQEAQYLIKRRGRSFLPGSPKAERGQQSTVVNRDGLFKVILGVCLCCDYHYD